MNPKTNTIPISTGRVTISMKVESTKRHSIVPEHKLLDMLPDKDSNLARVVAPQVDELIARGVPTSGEPKRAFQVQAFVGVPSLVVTITVTVKSDHDFERYLMEAALLDRIANPVAVLAMTVITNHLTEHVEQRFEIIEDAVATSSGPRPVMTPSRPTMRAARVAH